jgi:hypothetical protein
MLRYLQYCRLRWISTNQSEQYSTLPHREHLKNTIFDFKEDIFISATSAFVQPVGWESVFRWI